MKRWSDITRATNARIFAWAEGQPWARAMAVCQQDAQWHAEGNVWTHTKMVCAELERLAEWPTLDRAEQLQLLFTSLFHDSGKPATTALDAESVQRFAKELVALQPDLILSHVTPTTVALLQQAVASAEGIDTLTSSSQQNTSTVTLNLRLDANPDRAVADVLSKIQQVKSVLPREAQDPVVVNLDIPSPETPSGTRWIDPTHTS